MSHAAQDRRTPASRDAQHLDALRQAMVRANQARCLAPTQHHPRQCRCDRPFTDVDGCLKCGLPVRWTACDSTVQADYAEWCAREHATASRRAYRRRTGR